MFNNKVALSSLILHSIFVSSSSDFFNFNRLIGVDGVELDPGTLNTFSVAVIASSASLKLRSFS